MIPISEQIKTIEILKEASINELIKPICKYKNKNGCKCAIGYLLTDEKLKMILEEQCNGFHILHLIKYEFVSEKEIGLNKHLAYNIQRTFDYMGNCSDFIKYLDSEIGGLKDGRYSNSN